MNLFRLPILKNNYVWFLVNIHNDCVIIDPGSATEIINFVLKCNMRPVAIFLTHCHYDHTDGVYDIYNMFPTIRIYGPVENISTLYPVIVVMDNDKIVELNYRFVVFHTPGHTAYHVSYFCHPYLFCGDTIFTCGCGRTNTKEQSIKLFKSVNKIKLLPDTTLLCCGHDYTISNINFAYSVWPENKDIKALYSKLKNNEITYDFPSLLKNEKKLNIFLLTDNVNLHRKITNKKENACYIFCKLRYMKNKY